MLKLGLKPVDDPAEAQLDPARPACLEQLRRELSCAICLDICFEPSTTSCGHSFCRECLLSVLQKCGSRCPKCRQQLAGEMVKICPINTVLWNTIQLLFPTVHASKVKESSPDPAKPDKSTGKAPTVEQQNPNPNSNSQSGSQYARTGINTETHNHVEIIRPTSSSSSNSSSAVVNMNSDRPHVIRRTSATRVSSNLRNGSSSSSSSSDQSTIRTSGPSTIEIRFVGITTRPAENIDIIRQTRQSFSSSTTQNDQIGAENYDSTTLRSSTSGNLSANVAGDQSASRSISSIATAAPTNLRAVRNYRSTNRS